MPTVIKRGNHYMLKSTPQDQHVFTPRERRGCARYAIAHGPKAASEFYGAPIADVYDWMKSLEVPQPDKSTKFQIMRKFEAGNAPMVQLVCHECGYEISAIEGTQLRHCPQCQRRNTLAR